MGQEESTLAYDESVPEVQNLKVSEPAKLGEILKHEDVLLDKGKHRNENEQNLPGDGDPEAPREDSPAPAKTGDGADSEPTSPPPYDPEEDLAPTRGSLFWEYLPANPFRTAASEGAQPASSSCSALTAADMVEGVEAKAVMAALTSAMRELDAGLDDAKQAASKGRERHAAQLATYAEKNQVLANAIEQCVARVGTLCRRPHTRWAGERPPQQRQPSDELPRLTSRLTRRRAQGQGAHPSGRRRAVDPRLACRYDGAPAAHCQQLGRRLGGTCEARAVPAGVAAPNGAGGDAGR